ncbi:DUF433 domain-containing protein [Microcoleus sp. herbarium12]|uniref:DUF433 domain-containing protein n=1 Tax=Microcoleus sp. herbarium12 TaxID=3055437 RepID=UPI002FD1464E
MNRTNLLSRIAIAPNICFGKPSIRGHRIWVSLILDCLASGATIEEIIQQYPSIERDDILACIAYGAEVIDKNSEPQHLGSLQPDRVIYADFSEMANDTEYQAEALAICQEFEAADGEALLIGESEYETR